MQNKMTISRVVLRSTKWMETVDKIADGGQPPSTLLHHWDINCKKQNGASQLAGRCLAVQRLGPVHGLQGLLLDPVEEDGACWNVVNQSDHLASSPHLELCISTSGDTHDQDI